MDGAVEAEHDEERRVDEGGFDEPTTVRSALAASVRLLADDDVARRFEATVRTTMIWCGVECIFPNKGRRTEQPMMMSLMMMMMTMTMTMTTMMKMTMTR